VNVKGVGNVCQFAAFDFRNLGDQKFGADVDPRALKKPREDLRNRGKMEKSFINFVAHNPNWSPEEGGQHLLDNLLVRSAHIPRRSSTESEPDMSRTVTLNAAARSVLSDSAIFSDPRDYELPPHAALYPLLDNIRQASSTTPGHTTYAPPLAHPFQAHHHEDAGHAHPVPVTTTQVPTQPAPAPAPAPAAPAPAQAELEPAFAAESDGEDVGEGIPLRPIHTVTPPFEYTEP